ncbi:hypothetical protein ACJMK2_013042 [Sinanodonta woodiana]|uniref:Fibrinogen C-terminal domain-containing protein n=1 Tax=Sinanodonta woodiana TaxID=1069815 RepID=A0ABD3VA50_SINWO
MKLQSILQGVVLVSVLLLTISVNAKNATRRRKCRCEKYLGAVNKAIDTKLKEFEEMFSKFLEPMSDNYKKESAKLLDINVKLGEINGNMTDSQEELRREKYNLRLVWEHMYYQEQSADSLNSNFKALDSILKNVSLLVDKLEKMTDVGESGLISGDTSAMKIATAATKAARKTTIKTTETTATKVESTTTLPSMKVDEPQYPRDCHDIYLKGGMQFLGDYYLMVKPTGATKPFKVLCKIFKNAGWTVIQRRMDGSVNFYRNWHDYKTGFGNQAGEFWLGNDNIYYLTNQGDMMLRVEMEEWSGRTNHANYDYFRIEDESDKYRLHVHGYHGIAGDSLTPHWMSHDGKQFSTMDNDNDDRYYDNCAKSYHGAWWFNTCYESHLNGRYYTNGTHNNYFVRDGIQWNTIHPHSSLKSVEMMIKPYDASKLPNEV